MFKNYLKIAFRNLVKHKALTFINLTGLVVGITVSLHMLVYVIHENSFESFHHNKGRIYRVALEWGSDAHKIGMAGAVPALANPVEALKYE